MIGASPVLSAAISAGRPLPPSVFLERGTGKGVERIEIPRVDVGPLLVEDEAMAISGVPHPDRFATPIAAGFGPHNAGSWLRLADGSEVWRLRLHSPGALNLNLHLAPYSLPTGGAMWIHDPDGAQVHGPYTVHDQNRAGELWTPVVVGDEIELEVLVPAGTRHLVSLEVAVVNYGYKHFGGGPETEHPKQGDCHIDVICPEGDDWRRQIRSVARIVVDGGLRCSANLLNNTAEDDTPYLLTARHCLDTQPQAQSLVVYWNYESPACGLLSGGNLSDNQSGAELVAFWFNSDFSLLLLDEIPDPDFGVYYVGWDATGSAPQGAVGIHHPGADEKSISFDDNSLTRIDQYGVGEDYWLVGEWEMGVTEGGSSGSCIFEPVTGLCVGTLTDGESDCVTPDGSDWYGAFDAHWTGDGTPESRLSDWLDPGTTGQLTLAGKEPIEGGSSRSLWLIPAAASAPGAQGSNWKSQIVVVNPTHNALTVQLNFTAEGILWPGVPLLAEPEVVAAGRSLYLDDPLESRNPTSGMVYAILDGIGGLVSSRTYNLEPDGATFGQGIPGVPVDGAEAARYVLPLVHNAPDRFRTNVGVVQTSSARFVVLITAHASDGTELAQGVFTVSSAYRQINNIFRELEIEDEEVDGGWLVVELVGPAPGYWTCYASVVDSRTNDPTYVLPVEP